MMVFSMFLFSACEVGTKTNGDSSKSSSSSQLDTRSNGSTSDSDNSLPDGTSNSSLIDSKITNSTNSSNSNQSFSDSQFSNSSTSTSNSSVQPIDPPVVSPSSDLSDPVRPVDYTINEKNANLSGTTVNLSAERFSVQGYAIGVTGGGNLSKGDAKYIQVRTPDEFMRAINRTNPDNKNDTSFATTPMVVEVMNDIDLSPSAIQGSYSDAVQAKPVKFNPALQKSGVNTIYLTARQNLTIFSKNGSTIKHACFQIRGNDNNKNASKNIIIRNLRFEGAWEWDDSGKYDTNDWDIFTIRANKGEVSKIWIDHCTFTKPYDGTIDIKYGATDVTISWCAFLPHTTDDADFMSMMNYLEQNRSSFPNYNSARNGGASFEDMINFASINEKVHLVGHTDDNPGDDKIRVTYCNNYYNNCTERLPRLRMGNAHVFNCIFDASKANALENKIKSSVTWPVALKFNSNGSLGTNYGHLLLENCYINGINTPLRNNNNNAGLSYTGSVEMLYTYYTVENIARSCKYGDFTVDYNGRYTFLGNSTQSTEKLVSPFPINALPFDTDAFKKSLSYEYTLYDPLKLYSVQSGNVGAGKMNMTESQWLKSAYSSSDKFSNAVTIGGVKGSTANLGVGRK